MAVFFPPEAPNQFGPMAGVGQIQPFSRGDEMMRHVSQKRGPLCAAARRASAPSQRIAVAG
jgi:hypothetical protein